MSATITEPLLVTRDQLDAAIAIIERVATEFGLDIAIDANVYIDPEIASEPPVELLTVRILKEPGDWIKQLLRFEREARERLFTSELHAPQVSIRMTLLPEW